MATVRPLPGSPQYGDRKQLPWRNKPGCFRETNWPSMFAGSSVKLAGRRKNVGDSSSSTASRRKSTTGAGGRKNSTRPGNCSRNTPWRKLQSGSSEAQKLFATPSKEDNSESARFVVIAFPWNLWPRYCMCVAAKSFAGSSEVGSRLRSHRARCQEIMMSSVRESLHLHPGLTRHSRVVVHFKHPEDGQNAETRFGISRFGEIQVCPQKSNLAWERRGRLAMRWHLADARIESF